MSPVATDRTRHAGERGLSLGTICIMLAVFVASRLLLQNGGAPYFDPDSYKYLSGADSLRAHGTLPPLYSDVAVNGGALHVVPGYAYFLYALWAAYGHVTIAGAATAQAVVSSLGYLALADLVSRWVSRWAAVCVFVVVALSPSIGWLEYSMMPDSIAAPVLLLAFWIATVAGPSAPAGKTRIAGALVAGALVGINVLMRTSSQAYAPLPWLLAAQSRAGLGRTSRWTCLYLLAAAAPLAPWIMHNHAVHGVYAVAASTGRNLYFNAVWAGTIDRQRELTAYGLGARPVARAAYPLADAALQRQVATGKSIAEADAALGAIALAAYRTKSWTALAADRLAILVDLFVPPQDPGAASVSMLRPYHDWYLANANARPAARQDLERRFRYRFSDEYAAATADLPPPTAPLRTVVAGWMAMAFEGWPVLVGWLVGTLIVLWKSAARWQLLIVLAAPPAAFLATFAFFGAPIYRYQAGLHPFMLAMIVVGCASALDAVRSDRSQRS